MRYFLILLLAFFIAGCDKNENEALKMPPTTSEIPNDVPIAKSEPQKEVDKELPPLPVTE